MFLFNERVAGNSGYSRACRELALAMSKHTSVGIIQQDGRIPERFWHLLKDKFNPQQTTIFTRVYFDDPFKFAGFQGVIGNLVLESTKLPERAVRDCNDDRISQIWVPSKHCFDNYAENSIVENKMKIIPHGVSDIYKPGNSKAEVFTFLFVGGYLGKGDRKGADILAEAFRQEFKPEEKVRLHLKINTAYGLPPVQDLAGDNIFVDTRVLSEEEMVTLYQTSHGYVMPTRGEGFSMDGLEAMACGLPLITSSWGGQLDYAIHSASLISGDFKPAKFNPWDCGLWFEPDIEDLREKMRFMFENPPKVRYDMSKWNWNNAAVSALAALKEVNDGS